MRCSLNTKVEKESREARPEGPVLPVSRSPIPIPAKGCSCADGAADELARTRGGSGQLGGRRRWNYDACGATHAGEKLLWERDGLAEITGVVIMNTYDEFYYLAPRDADDIVKDGSCAK